jgi:hypothetical protein
MAGMNTGTIADFPRGVTAPFISPMQRHRMTEFEPLKATQSAGRRVGSWKKMRLGGDLFILFLMQIVLVEGQHEPQKETPEHKPTDHSASQPLSFESMAKLSIGCIGWTMMASRALALLVLAFIWASATCFKSRSFQPQLLSDLDNLIPSKQSLQVPPFAFWNAR